MIAIEFSMNKVDYNSNAYFKVAFYCVALYNQLTLLTDTHRVP